MGGRCDTVNVHMRAELGWNFHPVIELPTICFFGCIRIPGRACVGRFLDLRAAISKLGGSH